MLAYWQDHNGEMEEENEGAKSLSLLRELVRFHQHGTNPCLYSLISLSPSLCLAHQVVFFPCLIHQMAKL